MNGKKKSDITVDDEKENAGQNGREFVFTHDELDDSHIDGNDSDYCDECTDPDTGEPWDEDAVCPHIPRNGCDLEENED